MKTQKTISADRRLAPVPCSPLKRAVAAMLMPTIRGMHDAGIARVMIEKNGAAIVQLESGEVIDLSYAPLNKTDFTLASLIQWSDDLGEDGKRRLLDMLQPQKANDTAI